MVGVGGRLLLRPLGVALVAPLAACLQSPPGGGSPSCDGNTGIAEVALGRDHGCARLENGGVWCWGLNDQGQLGDGTLIDKAQPSQVASLRDVVRIAAGQDHTCALQADHTLWCWGSGSNGQLGDGQSEDSTGPVQVLLEDVSEVSMGDDFSCAIAGGGEVYCWGENEHGQAGPDFDEVRVTPTRIEVGAVALSLATGENHACALLEGGTVACWGGAELGQLGDDSLIERGTAAPVLGIDRATAVVSGRNHACAVVEGGALWCWGSNERGQLGALGDNPADDCANGEDVPVSCTPVAVDIDQVVTAAAAGLHHTCAVTAGGDVECFGGNESGQLGNGSFDDSAAPVKVRIDPTIAAIAAGETQNCAVSDSQLVYCWGSNRAGQLAETAALISTSPARVAQLPDVIGLEAGARHTCGRINGGVQCWGGNDSAQLGDGTLQSSATPVEVVAVAGSVPSLAPGEEHTCAINGSARVRCWGRNAHGELGPAGDEEVELAAVNVDLDGDVGAIDSGDEHVCAARTDGVLYCWGSDGDGQLGNGEPETSGPVAVSLPDVIEVSCGDEHTCALQNSGDVYCWGANDNGQLGDGSTAQRTQPAASGIDLGGVGATAVESGDEFSCALAGGAVLCWGTNDFGQLGDGTNEAAMTPQPVPLGGPAGAIALGTEHACAIVTEGDKRLVECWGRNDGGQLGDGTTESSPSPVAVLLDGDPLEITAGERHTCARVSAGETSEVYCWGSDVDGRLGSGRDLYYKTAVGPISVCQ